MESCMHTIQVKNQCKLMHHHVRSIIYTKHVITKETTIIILATCWNRLVCESLGIFRFTSSKKLLKCLRSFTASSEWDVLYRSQNSFISLMCSSVCSDNWICTLISTRFKTRCVSLQKTRTRFWDFSGSFGTYSTDFGDFQRC